MPVQEILDPRKHCINVDLELLLREMYSKLFFTTEVRHLLLLPYKAPWPLATFCKRLATKLVESMKRWTQLLMQLSVRDSRRVEGRSMHVSQHFSVSSWTKTWKAEGNQQTFKHSFSNSQNNASYKILQGDIQTNEINKHRDKNTLIWWKYKFKTSTFKLLGVTEGYWNKTTMTMNTFCCLTS